MKGNSEVIDSLQEILMMELSGINQYFIHAKLCENWGYERLAEKIRQESISEMKHAELVIDRILHLEGVPNLQRLDKIRIGEKVSDQLKADLELELAAMSRFNKAIALAVQVGDNGSREMLESMLVSEEDHLQWLESQLELIRQVGEPNYLAQQIHKQE
jgi:bacterioferritin